MNIDIAGIECCLPDFYQKADSTLDDQEGSAVLFARSEMALCFVTLQQIDARDAMPFDEETVIRLVHDDLDEDQGLVEVDSGVAGGHRYIYSIVRSFKEDNSAPGGVQYILCFHVESDARRCAHIQGYFDEVGTTGIRDSIVYSLQGKDGIPKPAKWARDPYDPVRENGKLSNYSEDARFDAMFPAHPLSIARETLASIVEGLEKAPDAVMKAGSAGRRTEDASCLAEGRGVFSAYWIKDLDDMQVSYDFSLPPSGYLESGDGGCGAPVAERAFEGEIDVIEWEPGIERADRADYALAACIGSVSGLVDALFVGEFSLERAKSWGDEKAESFVKRVGNWEMRRDGKKETDDLSKLIKHLEERHGLAADKATAEFGGGRQHHFRDFSHHLSPIGLACSLFTQFTGIECGVDEVGNALYRAKAIGTDEKGNLRIATVESTFIGSNFEEKILYGTIEWLLHLVSDMAGSHSSAGKGTGIPGPVLSLLKEISALPLFKETQPAALGKDQEMSFRLWLSKLFNGTLLARRDEEGKIERLIRFDLRAEIGIARELGRQVVPVILNECLVRSAYFLRRLYLEIKEKGISRLSDFNLIDGKRLVPFNNAVIRRMVTIASGSMVAVDTADAFVRALVKHKSPKKGAFWADFAVRINVVGVGRFFVVCAADAKNTIRETRWQRLVDERDGDALASGIADMSLLVLSIGQRRLLHSVERLMLDYDISMTKKENEKKEKRRWRDEWVGKTLEFIPLADCKEALYFANAKELFDLIEDERRCCESEAWLHLLLLEASFFTPYNPALENESGRSYKVTQEADYLDDVFVGLCPGIDAKELKEIRRAARRYRSILTGKRAKKVAGAVGTGALALGTAGAAAFLAPVIAPVLATTFFGGTVAGLSGAALTNASLALFGGGALAAGGLGMAGGTAVIAGGGALLGLAGGSSLSAATSIRVIGNERFVLDECVKMLVYSDVVLVHRMSRKTDIVSFEERLGELSTELRETLRQIEGASSSDKPEGKKRKRQAKIIRRSEKYIRKTGELMKDLSTERESLLKRKPKGKDGRDCGKRMR